MERMTLNSDSSQRTHFGHSVLLLVVATYHLPPFDEHATGGCSLFETRFCCNSDTFMDQTDQLQELVFSACKNVQLHKVYSKNQEQLKTGGA